MQYASRVRWPCLLTNLYGEQRSLIYQFANKCKAEDVPTVERQQIKNMLVKIAAHLENSTLQDWCKHSAELNGILGYYNQQLTKNQDIHWLIATDTWLGQETAQAICNALNRKGLNAEVKIIPDLRTDNLEEFRLGASELARLCAQEVKGMRDSGYRVVFNLTGGFKSIQGFMQSLGTLYADESIYIFETTKELLRLPKLPFQFDAIALARQHAHLFRRHKVGLPIGEQDIADVPETLLMRIGDEVTLSVWGDAIWAESEKTVLSEQLLPSIDQKLRYSPGFPDTVKNCSKEELLKVNDRLAELARHLNDNNYNSNRLDFKPIQAPTGGRTHECDAWSTGAAKRLFGYFNQGVFTVDALDQGLH